MTLQLEYVILNAENNVMMNITTERKFSNERKSKKIRRFISSGKICSASTVDREGHPRSRIINIMIAAEEGMYIVTSKGKPFYEQLEETGEIALSAMCPDCQSLKFYGKVKKVEKKWVDEVFRQNPGMNEVYPGDTRYILDAFLIYEGYGEWFDLLNYPINRETFSYGTAEEVCGFRITDLCIGCGACLKVCPQKCIEEGMPFAIRREHCLQCGACMEVCPAGAVKKLH